VDWSLDLFFFSWLEAGSDYQGILYPSCQFIHFLSTGSVPWVRSL